MNNNHDLKEIIEKEIRSKMEDSGGHKYIHVFPIWKQIKLDGTFDVEDLSIMVDTMMKYNRIIDVANETAMRNLADQWFEACQNACNILGVQPGESLTDGIKRVLNELNDLKNKQKS